MARFSAWGHALIFVSLALCASPSASPAKMPPPSAGPVKAPSSSAGPAKTPPPSASPAKTLPLRWETLPAPGPLPETAASGTFSSGDAKLWYASFGEGAPVLLLHGGLGNSNHFGDLVTALATKHRVIVMDSRGHGRSMRSKRGISYKQMADDVVALLDHLAIERVALVGWSDGGATGLDVAIRYPERLNKLFVIGTNYALDGVKTGGSKSKTFPEYFARCRREYARLAPDPRQLGAFLQELRAMWASQPAYTDEQLRAIQTPALVAIGEHDEVIRLDHVQKMAKLLPHGRLAVLPGVSHFAMWQDPETFLARLRGFLDEKPATKPAKAPATKPAKAPATKPAKLPAMSPPTPPGKKPARQPAGP